MKIIFLFLLVVLTSTIFYRIGFASKKWHRENQKWIIKRKYGGFFLEAAMIILSGIIMAAFVFIGGYLNYDFLDQFQIWKPAVTFIAFSAPFLCPLTFMAFYSKGISDKERRFSISEA